MKINRPRKKMMVWIACAALVMMIAPVPTHAGFISAALFGFEKVSDFLANLLYYFPLTPLAWLLAGLGRAVNYVVAPSPIITSSVVQIGWTVTRDFANMFFILILLGIALDYILFNSFGVKKALPTLLLVALLINFSLPIAGLLIDFANVFTQFFLSKVSRDGAFTEAIAKSLSLSEIFDTDYSSSGTLTNALVISQTNLTSVIFAIFFIWGTISVFFALLFMFLTRLGYLYVLLVILPIVLVAYAFPPTSKYFSEWKNSFFKWVMFAPAASFFLYLSLLVLSANVASGFQATTANPDDSAFFNVIFTYIIAWTFMGGSLVAANQMGIKTAGALAAVEAAVRGKVKEFRGKTAGAMGRRLKASERLESVASGLQKMPRLNLLASGVRGLAAKTKMAVQKQQEPTTAEKATWETLSDGALAKEQEVWEKSIMPGAGAKVAHIALMRAKKGKLRVLDEHGEIDPKATEALVRSSYKAAKAHGNKAAMQTILQSNPVVAREIVQEEWEHDDKEKKLIGQVYDINTKKLVSGRNKATGKTFEDAQKDVFDISRADFANTKGQWNVASVKEFIESGHLTKMHLREAQEINDGEFTTFVAQYYKNIDDMQDKVQRNAAIEKIKKLNPSLTNTYITGNLADVGLGKPKDASTWETATQTSGGNKQQQPRRQAGFRPGGMP